MLAVIEGLGTRLCFPSFWKPVRSSTEYQISHEVWERDCVAKLNCHLVALSAVFVLSPLSPEDSLSSVPFCFQVSGVLRTECGGYLQVLYLNRSASDLGEHASLEAPGAHGPRHTE